MKHTKKKPQLPFLLFFAILFEKMSDLKRAKLGRRLTLDDLVERNEVEGKRILMRVDFNGKPFTVRGDSVFVSLRSSLFYPWRSAAAVPSVRGH